MAYVLSIDESLGEGLARVVREQVGRARTVLTDSTLASATKVHEARKALKKARAALRLSRPCLADDARRLERELALLGRSLGATRDRDVARATLTELTGEEAGFAEVRARLAPARTGASVARSRDPSLRLAVASLTALEEKAKGLRVPITPEMLAKRLKRAAKQARKAMFESLRTQDEERRHAWRKRVKAYAHGVRLLGKLATSVEGPDVKRLDALAETLGRERDLALVEAMLAGDGEPPCQPRVWAALRALIRDERRALLRSAEAVGKSVLARPPRGLKRRLREAWAADRVGFAGSAGSLAAGLAPAAPKGVLNRPS